MANDLYNYALTLFAKGEIHWKASGGDTIRAFLVDSASYTPDLVNHDFLNDIPTAARKGNNGGSARGDAPQITLIDPVNGICDGQDTTFTTVPAGGALEYIVIFKDDGEADASSPLIALIDTATGLPITPNGADIVVQWDNGANKIFGIGQPAA